MKLDSESAPNAFFHPFGGNNDEWYLSKKFHDPKPTPKDRPNLHPEYKLIWSINTKVHVLRQFLAIFSHFLAILGHFGSLMAKYH